MNDQKKIVICGRLFSAFATPQGQFDDFNLFLHFLTLCLKCEHEGTLQAVNLSNQDTSSNLHHTVQVVCVLEYLKRTTP